MNEIDRETAIQWAKDAKFRVGAIGSICSHDQLQDLINRAIEYGHQQAATVQQEGTREAALRSLEYINGAKHGWNLAMAGDETRYSSLVAQVPECVRVLKETRNATPPDVVELVEALQLILPLAKGYAANNKIESNQRYCAIAESALAKYEASR